VYVNVKGTGNLYAPHADAGPDQTAHDGDTITLDGSNSSDLDVGQTLNYLWEQLSGTAVMLSDAAVVKPTFTAPAWSPRSVGL